MLKKSITVIIPIFGNVEYFWGLAMKAYESIQNQTVYPEKIIISTTQDMASARNTEGLKVETDYIIFLDADDTLDRHYIENITKNENADIVVPAVHRIYQDGTVNTDQAPYLPKNLLVGNYIVIGALIKSELFKKLGGFHDYEALEDWDFYLRAEEAGATFGQCPSAIYQINVRENSRNTSSTAHDIVLNNAKKRRGIL